MTRLAGTATAGSLLLLPSLVLVSTGVLGLDRPDALVHPILVVGGIAFALAVNAASLLRLRLAERGDDLVATVSIRVRGATLNLLVLGAGLVLLAIVFAYLVVENFQPRIVG